MELQKHLRAVPARVHAMWLRLRLLEARQRWDAAHTKLLALPDLVQRARHAADSRAKAERVRLFALLDAVSAKQDEALRNLKHEEEMLEAQLAFELLEIDREVVNLQRGLR